ncbi:protein of unknown function DUF29 [Pleurocapsa sp. PCC 7327]|uniref:DUF29 domain-containing protein n=1 Tax=Pleurocapsa sp. PCC 7327 TaxID=118163 RepID=UPI00029FAA35|nr:DUF29 domain-containing protein [Pleurocapsa sp. PCC 7327]AFY75955.1 protein of unknown function DUF29 [Pleurocapsa sp. PCC 7327]
MVNSLYDKDFYLWLKGTAQKLRDRDFSNLDIDNLVEEIESMGRSEKRELYNRLIVLLMHLLKWKYQASYRSNSWISAIIEQRRQIEKLLLDSPSLKPTLEETFEQCYQKARRDAASETGLAIATFPEQSPFSILETLSDDYFPN